MSNIAIIPARGGSSRIPRKNIRMFNGKPIIAYSIETARKTFLFDAVYVSTEDAEIADIARTYRAEVIERPPDLAEINAPDCGTQQVVRHALMTLRRERGYACCLYPCAPLITGDNLNEALNIIRVTGRPYVYVKGCFYWGRVRSYLKFPELDNNALKLDYGIDIDTEDDWQRAEKMYFGAPA